VFYSFFSTYQFASDVHLVLIMVYFLDGIRLVKYSSNNFLYSSRALEVRYVKLNSSDEDTVTFGEIDFDVPNKGSPRSNNDKVRNVEMVLYSKIVIRERDSFLFRFFGKRVCERVLDFCETNSAAVSLTNGFFISIPLLLWICLDLTGISEVDLSWLCLISIPVVLFRFLIKSKLVLVHLLFRMEFFLESMIHVVALVFLGISLPDPNHSVLPLILMSLVFLDFRLSDSYVNLSSSSPFHPLYFIPVVCSTLFVLPILGNFGCFPSLNTQSFPLTSNGIYNNASGDVFLLENPDFGVFARVRYSQLVFDGMIAMGVRLVLEFFHKLMFERAVGLSGLSYLWHPVHPKFVKFSPPFPWMKATEPRHFTPGSPTQSGQITNSNEEFRL
jgi:hypothetical protein